MTDVTRRPLKVCPWESVVAPTPPASPTTAVVAVLALADVPLARVAATGHLPAMGSAVHAELGLLHGDVTPGRPMLPLTFLRRPEALVQLARLDAARGDAQRHVVEARGFGFRAAQEALVEWDDSPLSGAMFVTGVVAAIPRAAALS